VLGAAPKRATQYTYRSIRRKKMRYVLDEYLSGNAVEVNSVFPYDGERFNFLREVPRILT
jgi:hypothetical protein